MKASDLEKLFDDGENIVAHLDLSRVIRPGEQLQRVNVDFPLWMIQALDRESKRLGVPRQSVIKFWIAEKLEDYTA